jgi:hypothetical protein
MAKIIWEEKARIPTSSKTDVVVSCMVEDLGVRGAVVVKGVVVNKFIDGSGFCKGGPFVPLSEVRNLINILQNIADEYKVAK